MYIRTMIRTWENSDGLYNSFNAQLALATSGLMFSKVLGVVKRKNIKKKEDVGVEIKVKRVARKMREKRGLGGRLIEDRLLWSPLLKDNFLPNTF